MEEQFIGLFVRRFAVVAGDGDVNAVRDQRAFERLDAMLDRGGDGHRVGPGPLGDGDADGGRHMPGVAILRPAPDARLVLLRPLGDGGDIAQIDRRPGHRTHRQHADLRRAVQRLTRGDGDRLAVLADHAHRERTIGLFRGVDHAVERHLIKRQLGRIRRDPDRLALAAGDEGQPDIIDLGDLGAQPTGEFVERLIRPLPRGIRLGR